MKDIRIEKMADVLVNYSLQIKQGDLFRIKGTYLSMPLIREVYILALKRGAHPMIRIIPEEIDYLFYQHANEEQLQFENPVHYFENETIDVTLSIDGSYNTRDLSNIDPEKMKRRTKGQERLIRMINRRTDCKELIWCGTQYPTHADAQEANMSLDEYERFVFEACLLHLENPIEVWKKISKEQSRVVKILNSKSKFHVLSQGTDLKITTNQRNWVNCDGKNNFPNGEVYTSPVETLVEGCITFSFPGIENGKEIENIYLEFKEGKVVKARADKGEQLLLSLIDTDEGSKRVGEFAIGTNYGIKKFTKNMLFDEKIGGTIHLALGEGFAESGSENESLIHWDMLCDMRQGGQITADDEVIYKDGRFVI